MAQGFLLILMYKVVWESAIVQLSYLDKNMENIFVRHCFFMQFYGTYGETAKIWVTVTFSNGFVYVLLYRDIYALNL